MKSQAGYSLLELIIVIVIIAILAAVAIPNYLSIATRARVIAATQDVNTISLAAGLYKLDHNGVYPNNLTQLTAAPVAPYTQYMQYIPLDPWGTAYVISNGAIISRGADKVAGGVGVNADIVSTANL